MDLTKMSIKKLLSLVKEIQTGGVGMKEVYLLRDIALELQKRGYGNGKANG